MEAIKFVVFLEFIIMILCAIAHLMLAVMGYDFPLIVYPIMVGIILFVMIFIGVVVMPLERWWFGD